MESIRVNRSELVGKTQNNTAILEALICANALNRTGNLNYNENGKLDGVGFEKVSGKFIDNFVFYNIVPDYNTKKFKGKKPTNIFVASQNKTIRDLLAVNGFINPIVKAIGMDDVEVCKEEMLENIPDANKNKEATKYYEQKFKIACPNMAYATVMNFLRNVDYNGYGFFLKDVDVTIDYAGSFDKYKCINHLTSCEDFREQKSMQNCDEYPRTVVDNDSKVGMNCLTWMESIDGIKTRQKIYNKMVQMLETKSVRSSIGSLWKEWVCQTDTRLAEAKDKAKNRGLTRAEVTFYIQDEIPNDEFIEDVLERIVKYIPKDMVYSTSYATTWESYCDSFKHSLVCVDRSKDIAIIVCSYNQTTRNISGQLVQDWLKKNKEKWCLDKLTLNGNLPLDIIEVVEIAKVFENKKKDVLLEISGNRYCKVNNDKSTRFTTRLVSNKAINSYNVELYKDENIDLLQKAGLLEHTNCIPLLAKRQSSNTSKADADFKSIGALEINIFNRKEEKKVQQEQFNEKYAEEMKKIEEKTKPLLLEFQNEKEKKDRIEDCKWMFRGVDTGNLGDLAKGKYIVKTAKKENSWFGKTYRLLIRKEKNKQDIIVWSNEKITKKLEEAENAKTMDLADNFLYLQHDNLGVLEITGYGYTPNRHKMVYCNITLNPRKSEEKPKQLPVQNIDIVTPVIPRENLLQYKDYPNLIALPIGSVHNVEEWGFVKHYGIERLVVSLDGKIYQAGDNLEENINDLKYLCKIKIEKIRTNNKRHVKYAVCSVYEKDDWTAYLDYSKMDFLPDEKMGWGDTCILDIRTVNFKGKKRKLLLTKREEEEEAVVYRLRKPKLEEKIKVGMI